MSYKFQHLPLNMQAIVTKTHLLTFALLVCSAFNAFAQLGSAASDLVFTPITPCRLLDTRSATVPAATPIAAYATRNFLVWDQTNFASQGGSLNSNCGLAASSNTAALAVNFTVVTPITGGYITAFPSDVVRPVAATVNFEAGSVRGNSAIVKIAQSSSTALSIYTTSQTHVVADVVGYYSKPVSAGSLDCESPSGPVLVLANTSGLATKQCSAGYTLTGGGCDDYSFDSSLVVIKTSPMLDNSGWFCRWENRTATDVTAFVRPRCCRIPGR